MKKVVIASLGKRKSKSNASTEKLIQDLKSLLSNIIGISPSELLVRRHRNSGVVKIHARYNFGRGVGPAESNMSVLVNNGYQEEIVLTDYGKSVEAFMGDAIQSIVNTLGSDRIQISQKLSGSHTLFVSDKVVLTLTDVIFTSC